MTALDLQGELERWINYNEATPDADGIDWFNIIKQLALQGVSDIEVRQKLKEMGFIIDDYGVLQKRLP